MADYLTAKLTLSVKRGLYTSSANEGFTIVPDDAGNMFDGVQKCGAARELLAPLIPGGLAGCLLFVATNLDDANDLNIYQNSSPTVPFCVLKPKQTAVIPNANEAMEVESVAEVRVRFRIYKE